MEVFIVKGSIANSKVDVIVNTTRSDLNLSDGLVSKALLQAGGVSLQQECDNNYPDGVTFGEIVVTNGGNLKCKKVYHTALPYWANDGENILEQFIMECFESADADGYTSIAFPALGAGNLNYPTDAVAKIFFNTIIDFSNDNPASLQRVVLVVFPANNDVIQAFHTEQSKHTLETSIQINSRLDQTSLSANAQMTSPSRNQSTRNRTGVSYVTGDIVKQNADVLVNSTTQSLNLTSGPITKAILAAAGDKIQQECKTNYPNGIKTWGIAVTSGGNLQCKKIYHTTLDSSTWTTIKQEYQDLIQLLLNTAESAGYSSIAIPVLGAGVLDYPRDEVAEIMFKTALAFRGIHLKSITFVVHPKDNTNQQAFSTELGKHMHLKQNVVPAGTGAAFKITLVKGDISQQKVDAIVNSTTPDLNLQSGPVTKAIVEVGGDSLQQQCKDNYPNGIKCGDLAVTGGGNLNCKYVYHTTLDKWSSDGSTVQAFRVLIENCLIQAANHSLTSIAFPVLGTGVLKYPADVVSKVIFETFDRFSKKHPNTSVQEVKIVIHPKDTKNWRVFATISNQQSGSLQQQGAMAQADPDEPRFHLPPFWSLMNKDDFVKLVQVLSGNQEYDSVVKSFTDTLQGLAVTIVKVERIQNKTLYLQYQAMRDRFKNKNPGIKNELTLWHGTSSEAISSINIGGFNRSYCGKNATFFGEGVYFASNSSYSAQDKYAQRDSSGYKYIYQATVLTGVFCDGQSGFKVPPPMPNSPSHIRFDSVVNATSNPEIYVIFHDTQAYPQYLITFQ